MEKLITGLVGLGLLLYGAQWVWTLTMSHLTFLGSMALSAGMVWGGVWLITKALKK